jgi:hypothetical protein
MISSGMHRRDESESIFAVPKGVLLYLYLRPPGALTPSFRKVYRCREDRALELPRSRRHGRPLGRGLTASSPTIVWNDCPVIYSHAYIALNIYARERERERVYCVPLAKASL